MLLTIKLINAIINQEIKTRGANKMTIITGIVKKTWEAEQKMVGYFRVDGVQYEINQDNIVKIKAIMVDAKNKGVKIEQRKIWLNENLNPLQA